jgi:dTDP-4-dehydrorhamnose 3,5-epimerase
MIFEATPIPGLFVTRLEPIPDERGFFSRAFCAEEFRERGLNPAVEQCSLSYNRKRGTLRGMHYQKAPAAEAKLVRCIRGSIFDVAVDLRPDSPAFLRWFAAELTSANRLAMYVPEGCAHGFLSLEDDCEIFYLSSRRYTPALADGFRYDDPAIGIRWPASVTVISPKDVSWPPLAISSTEIHK